MKPQPSIFDIGFRDILKPIDAFFVMRIRNQCREYMTRDGSKISLWRQIRWYFSYIFGNDKTTVTLMFYKGWPVGYGLIAEYAGRVYISGGLGPKYRGIGLGRALFSHLVNRCGDQIIYLEVLKSNLAAYQLYRSLGFVETDSDERIVVMRRV